MYIFPDEPGKQARSAIRIKNSSKSYVAFKVMVYAVLFVSFFQESSPYHCMLNTHFLFDIQHHNMFSSVLQCI